MKEIVDIEKIKVLVLDEPTRNLSPTSQDELIKSLKKFKGGNNFIIS